jgi:hypothetical protein
MIAKASWKQEAFLYLHQNTTYEHSEYKQRD